MQWSFLFINKVICPLWIIKKILVVLISLWFILHYTFRENFASQFLRTILSFNCCSDSTVSVAIFKHSQIVADFVFKLVHIPKG